MKLPFKISRVYILIWVNKLLFYPGRAVKVQKH